MKKQTAVEWLKKELEEYGSSSHLSLDWETFDELVEQAKAIEREQMEKAVSHGISNADMTNNRGYFDFDKYYNETYKGGEQ